jgi:trehalose 6-phosphate phosphatase
VNMSRLFSEKGLQRLDQIVRPGLLCAFDFDGTLAPIVSQPEQAQVPDDIRRRLIGLSEYAPVAIITGRSVPDIRARLGFAPDFIIGNHGLEGVPGWELQAACHERLCRGWRKQLAGALRGMDPAIRLEDKRYSLSLHYRHARDAAAAARSLTELCATLVPPPRIVSGKYVFNLLAQDAGDKGSALEQLMLASGAASALYVGDDVTDEDVFRLPRADLVSIRVEHAADSAADFFLPRLHDVTYLLDELTARLRALGALNWIQTEAANST